MNSVEVLREISDLDVPLIETRDLAEILRISTDSAAKYLESLRSKQFVEKLSRGKWVVLNEKFDPMQIAEFLTSPKESYLSLHTALFYHGMIEQIPARIYAVTIDRSRQITTPLGTVSLHHCNPEFFVGYHFIKSYLKIAEPEKALVDYFYFAPSKNRQFTRLPELELPKKFSWRTAWHYCSIIPSPRTRTSVRINLERIRAASS